MSASSPLTDPPSSTAPLAHPALRQPREIPYEVVQSVQSYFEEDLNAQGFDFLYTLAVNSHSEVLIPPLSHLTLAATVCIHPNTTTRTEDAAKLAQSAAAFRLLRFLYRIAGHNIKWREAFHYRKYDFFQPKIDIYTQFESKHKYMTNGVFTRAEDFWSVVGWAFNCACIYPARWDYYEPFLSLMLDILEADFQAVEPDESLLWSYIELATGSHSRSRRIIRAIFADGTSKYLNEFREIFAKELNPPQVKQEEDRDYGGLSSGDVSEDEKRPQKRIRSARSSNESLREDYKSPNRTLGPPATLRLRARLMRLLAEVVNIPSLTAVSPSTFVDRDELYTLFVEFVKPLPLPLFQEFILPNTHTGTAFDPLTHTRLCEAILQRTLESRAPATPDGGLLTAERLIQCYLPYGASGSGVDAQTRVSLLVEALTRRVELNADMEVLPWAAEEGIKRREDYAREATKKKKTKDDEAVKMLKESGIRLRAIFKAVDGAL
jgi:hypothetical protein